MHMKVWLVNGPCTYPFSMLTVSVLVATYQGAAFLDEQLDSIAAQTHPPLELVVTDDGSSDGTVEIVEAFATRAPFPVRLVRHPTPRGHGANFLSAIDLCQGQLIAFADQDDVWLPSKLGRCAAVFTNADVMLCVHKSVLVDANLQRLPVRRLHTGLAARSLQASPLHIPHGSHSVLRRELVSLMPPNERPRSIYDERPQTHDEWAHYAATTFGNVEYLDDELMLFRRSAAAASGLVGEQSWQQLLRVDPWRTASGRAAAAQARAQHLRSREDQVGELDAMMLAATRYDVLARAEAIRADVLIAAGDRRLVFRRLLAATRRGAYRSGMHGGCGLVSAIRDTALLVAPPPRLPF
jgi:glycosyltransferase involved in cell wall biosynthesis